MCLLRALRAEHRNADGTTGSDGRDHAARSRSSLRKRREGRREGGREGEFLPHQAEHKNANGTTGSDGRDHAARNRPSLRKEAMEGEVNMRG